MSDVHIKTSDFQCGNPVSTMTLEGRSLDNDATEEFLEVDDELLNRVLNEDRNRSERNEIWCRNRFNSWRKRKGMDCSKNIEDYDLRELGQVLTR